MLLDIYQMNLIKKLFKILGNIADFIQQSPLGFIIEFFAAILAIFSIFG